MGGNALKNVCVSRINLKQLYFIQNDIYNKLQEYIDITFPIQNPDKTDFGDVDILYSHKKDNFILSDYIKELYEPIEMVHNGDVLSFSYNYNNDYVQVDFIKCKNLIASKYYFSYGDIGLIIGQIANYYDIKFGFDGLFIKLTSKHIGYNDDIADKLELSSDFENICKFFDLDFSLWGNFSSENQIFDWIFKSKYFTKNIFINMNSKQRSKLTKQMYSRFINYIEKLEPKDIIKYSRQEEAIKYFNAQDKLNQIIELYKIKNDRKLKFSGKKLLELGLINEPKNINIFIQQFKKYINNQLNIDFNNWLDSNTIEKISKEIIDFHKIYLSQL